jgi:hypothetical protein
MRKRRRLNRRKSKKLFRNTAGAKTINQPRIMRGGYRK